jgi:hypothetical protein
MQTKKVTTLGLALMLALAGLVAPVSARPTINIGSGQTRVQLSNDFIGALGALGLSAGAIGNSFLLSGVAGFPVTAGVLDLQNAKGEINHAGGLFLATRTTRVELTAFSIDTAAATPVLTGLVTVNGDFVGRVPLFRLELPALTLPLQPQAFNTLFIPGVKVTLSPEAAAALNSVFSVTAFTAGFNIGTASVFAVAVNSRRWSPSPNIDDDSNGGH